MTEHRTPRPTEWAKAVIALVMTVLALVATTGTAGAATGRDFSAQARSLGLSGAQARSLQDRADAYLAGTGGTQVAANKIVLKGGAGVLLLALPGERRARDLDAPRDTRGASAVPCPYDYVCAYSLPDFTGDQVILYYCDTLVRITWNTTGSWINNQSAVDHAKFYDRNKNLGWTSPGGYSEDRNAPWAWVWWLSAC